MHNALHFHEIFYLYIENDVALHVLEYVCIILLCIGLIKPNHFDNPYRYYQLLASCDNSVDLCKLVSICDVSKVFHVESNN